MRKHLLEEPYLMDRAVADQKVIELDRNLADKGNEAARIRILDGLTKGTRPYDQNFTEALKLSRMWFGK